MLIKVVSFLFKNPLDGKESVQATSLFFDNPEHEQQTTDEQLLQMVRAQGVNAIRIIRPEENVIGVNFSDDATR